MLGTRTGNSLTGNGGSSGVHKQTNRSGSPSGLQLLAKTNPHLWRPILDARKKGGLVVTIDPIRTRTAAASDRHLAPMPGTDAALALGLLHVVLAEGKEDSEFISQRT